MSTRVRHRPDHRTPDGTGLDTWLPSPELGGESTGTVRLSSAEVGAALGEATAKLLSEDLNAAPHFND